MSAEELRAVARRVGEAEAAGRIPPLEQTALPGAVLEPADAPAPGAVVARRRHERFGATELTLSNGMRVCSDPRPHARRSAKRAVIAGLSVGAVTARQVTYKCTPHADDQVLVTGWAPGGLSEVSARRRRERCAGLAFLL